MKRLALHAAFAAFALLMQPDSARASGEKIALMIGGIDKIIYLPAKLAERLGFFAEEGLEVELLSEPSGVHAEDVLLSGAVHGVVGFYDHTIQLQAKGKAVVSVVQLSQAPGEALLVSSRAADRIRSAADLAGQRLGVTGLGSSTHLLTQYLAIVGGVKSSEFAVIPVGGGDTFIAAMKQQRIDAGMTTEPTISRLLQSGDARILIDMRSPDQAQRVLGGLYPAACLYMRASWINKNKAVLQKLVNAMVGTLRYIQAHSAEEIAARMPEAYYAGNKGLYVKALASSKAMFTPDGRMPESGPPTVLKVLSMVDRNVREKRIDLSMTYTTEFVSTVKGPRTSP